MGGWVTRIGWARFKCGQSRVWAGVGQIDGALGLAWKGVPGFGHRAPGFTRFRPLPIKKRQQRDRGFCRNSYFQAILEVYKCSCVIMSAYLSSNLWNISWGFASGKLINNCILKRARDTQNYPKKKVNDLSLKFPVITCCRQIYHPCFPVNIPVS